MQSETLEAIVVRLTDYGESDRIVGLLTPARGRISAFAPSAKKSARRFGGGLDLFSYVRAEVKQPRDSQNSLWRLSRIHLANLHYGIREDISKFATASYFSECIWQLAAEGDPQLLLFEWWRNTLLELSKEEADFHRGVRLDVELLKICGYGPRWNACTECGNVPQGEKVFFSYDRGGLSCESCRKVGEGKWMKAVLIQELMNQRDVASGHREEARQILCGFMNHVLGRRPKSQEFREEVLRGNSE